MLVERTGSPEFPFLALFPCRSGAGAEGCSRGVEAGEPLALGLACLAENRQASSSGRRSV